MTDPTEIHGVADEGFGAVADVFRGNFLDRGELGAGVAVYVDGRPVVDLWGGIADRRAGRPWTEQTSAIVFSCTKGVLAMAAYRLVEDGLLDLDAPVARYWPAFARNGKEAITTRWLLSHRAGLPAIDRQLTREEALSWDPVIAALEDQAPLWEPGTAHTYHPKTYGWLVGEVIRRITGLTPGRFVRERFGEPLGLHTWIGLPIAMQGDVARTEAPDWSATDPTVPPLSPKAQEISERAVTLDGVFPFPDLDGEVTFNDPEIRAAELPGGNGISTARSLARLYGACVSTVDGIRVMQPSSIDDALVEQSSGPQLYGSPTGGFRWGTGFMLDAPPWRPMLGSRSFGHDGAGGLLAFADADRRVGFAFVTNQMGNADDERANRLVGALRESLEGRL